jgi:hypothetical protein
VDWEKVLRQAVIPVASAYVVFLAILASYRRQRAAGVARKPTGPEPTWRDLVRYLVNTALGGSTVFLLIVAVFYLVLGGQSPRLLREALVEGSALAFGIVIPAFLVISWLYDRRR